MEKNKKQVAGLIRQREKLYKGRADALVQRNTREIIGAEGTMEIADLLKAIERDIMRKDSAVDPKELVAEIDTLIVRSKAADDRQSEASCLALKTKIYDTEERRRTASLSALAKFHGVDKHGLTGSTSRPTAVFITVRNTNEPHKALPSPQAQLGQQAGQETWPPKPDIDITDFQVTQEPLPEPELVPEPAAAQDAAQEPTDPPKALVNPPPEPVEPTEPWETETQEENNKQENTAQEAEREEKTHES